LYVIQTKKVAGIELYRENGLNVLTPPIGRIVFSSTYAIIRLLRENVRYPWLEVEADVLHELEASEIRYDDNSS
jgi:hypothetical protein